MQHASELPTGCEQAAVQHCRYGKDSQQSEWPAVAARPDALARKSRAEEQVEEADDEGLETVWLRGLSGLATGWD